MKTLFTLLLSLFSILSMTMAQTAAADSLALVDLYNDLDGPNWKDNENWLTGPVDNWTGITVTDGRVTKIRFSGQNDMTGTLPASLGNLEELVELLITNNRGVTGAIPDQIWDLPKLVWVGLYNCSLTGPVPLGPLRAPALTRLELEGNDFSGTIPSEYGQLTHLTSLTLSSNQLTGTIPSSLQNLTGLTRLLLGGNFDPAPFPEWIGGLTQLGSLSLSRCNLFGPLPESLRDHPSLYQLLVNGNQLDGTLEIVESWPRIRSVNFFDNQFTGMLDPAWFEGKPIFYITASGNNLRDLGDFTAYNLEDLIRLSVAENQLGFDDLEPNRSLFTSEGQYHQQQKLLSPDTLTLYLEQKLEIDAGSGGEFTSYIWYKNDEAIPGETGRTLVRDPVVPADAGVYYCLMVNDSLPGLVLERHAVLVNVENTTARYFPERNEQLNLYPNPASDRLTIEVEGVHGPADVEVRTLLGQTLNRRTISSWPYALDTSALPPGQYFLLVRRGDRRYARSFVKE